MRLNDSDSPLMELWKAILLSPEILCDAYRDHFRTQADDPRAYFNEVRKRFNTEHRPADLLYLINRCVKGAVRYNRSGEFNQGADHRRLGARPEEVERRIFGTHRLLRGRCGLRVGDFTDALAEATPQDIVYLDPPYQGTSEGSDGRYRNGLARSVLISALNLLEERHVSYIVSYDGIGPNGAYGTPLPDSLARCIEVRTGRSAQATLLGREVETMERLYVSHDLECVSGCLVEARSYAQPSLL